MRAGPELQLFYLASDPGERRDLAGKRPELVHVLLAVLEGSDSAATMDPDAELSPELAERHRALGY